jgi:hypothetical protein
MCDVCAVFGIGDHWTDAAKLADGRFPARDIQRHRRHRRERIVLMNRLLAPLELTCEDWDGDGFVINDRAGRMRIAHSLADFWKEAEALAGRTLDPLDLRFEGDRAVW